MSTPENRPARFTPNFNLPVPGDAGPADYVTDTGTLADAIDVLGGAAGGGGDPNTPSGIGWWPGDIKPTAARTPPAGWLLCNGQAVARDVFAGLFEAIGTSFGAGDGVTTFNVPDLRDRFPLGESASANLGRVGGEASHVLSAAEMPYHAHGTWTGTESADHAHYTSGQTGGRNVGHVHWTGISVAGGPKSVVIWTSGAQGSYWNAPGTSYQDWGSGGENTDHSHGFGAWSGGRSAAHQHQITAEGGNAPHNNLPPFQSVNYFIKT
jgi:microcystin-dependent protein